MFHPNLNLYFQVFVSHVSSFSFLSMRRLLSAHQDAPGAGLSSGPPTSAPATVTPPACSFISWQKDHLLLSRWFSHETEQCYGLNHVPPQNSLVEVLTPSDSECSCVWR